MVRCVLQRKPDSLKFVFDHHKLCKFRQGFVDAVTSLQAERIMEALELYKEENRKLEEHKYACQSAGKEVETGIVLHNCPAATTAPIKHLIL